MTVLHVSRTVCAEKQLGCTWQWLCKSVGSGRRSDVRSKDATVNSLTWRGSIAVHATGEMIGAPAVPRPLRHTLLHRRFAATWLVGRRQPRRVLSAVYCNRMCPCFRAFLGTGVAPEVHEKCCHQLSYLVASKSPLVSQAGSISRLRRSSARGERGFSPPAAVPKGQVSLHLALGASAPTPVWPPRLLKQAHRIRT